MSFELKYLKYKNKYLNLKKKESLKLNQSGGGLFNLFSNPTYDSVIKSQLEQFNEAKERNKTLFQKHKDSLDSVYYNQEHKELTKDEERLEKLFKIISEDVESLHDKELVLNKVTLDYNDKKKKVESATHIVNNTLELIKKNNLEYISTWTNHKLVQDDLKKKQIEEANAKRLLELKNRKLAELKNQPNIYGTNPNPKPKS
jgi:hypothetical protein